jgi:uncharacterized protein involved in response to NO
MIPIQPAPAGLPSGSFGGRRRHSGRARVPWRMARLLHAPHRLAFFAGASMLALAALWWAVALLARNAGVVLPYAVSPTTAHALVMSFGFMPLFVIGFAFTAGPRWLQMAPVDAAVLTLPVLGALAGWGLAMIGVHLSSALAGVGLAIVAAALALATGRLMWLVVQSPVADRAHPALVVLGLGVTALALWVAAVAVVLQQDSPARAAAHFTLWGGMGLIFVSVAHRMIPFFTAAALPTLDAWRPRALLAILATSVALQAPFAAAEAWPGGLSHPLASALRAALEFPAGALLMWLALRWGLVQSLRHCLLAMLHMGFFWLGVAFTLGGVSHALMSLTGGTLSLGLAPLHAFTMGYLGSTLIAMATRVACGHSGRALVADDWAWAMFWALQVAVLARVAAALWPAQAGVLAMLAAQFWLAAVGAWAVRHGRWFGRPRVDGQVG